MQLQNHSLSLPYISIQPNKLTTYFQSEKTTHYEKNENTNIKQPRNNDPKRGLSTKARKRIQSKIQWLLTFSKPKRIFNDYTNKHFTFRINFITLTLPALQFHTDKTIKSKALNQFITELRKNFDLKNYVWRAEAQRNGNIHFHFVTDTYMPWFVIRRVWNRQLRKLGYIEKYYKKFSAMTYKDYQDYCIKAGVKDLSIILQRYNYGKKTNWKDPNTTDIHSTKNIKNIAAYLAKYMSKDEGEKDKDGRYKLKYRKLEGTIWRCSESLSKCKSIIELVDSTYANLMDAAVKVKGAFVLKEDYFSFIGVQFKQLETSWFRFIQSLFKQYKKEIGYISGGIPEKRYQYKPT